MKTSHNPDNLTDEQIETKDGWRLLAKQEISEGERTEAFLIEIEGRCSYSDKWFSDSYRGSCKELTYRTKLTPEALKCLRAK